MREEEKVILALRQQSAALVSALRETAKIVHNGRTHQWRDFEKCTDKDCKRWRELLAPYAPAEEKKKP